MEYVVQTNNLSKRFGKEVAVEGLNMKIRKGEIYGFLGPNGAGKTTLFKLILDMINRDVIPAVTAYSNLLCDVINNKKALGVDASVELELLNRLSACNKDLFALASSLKMAVASAERSKDILEKAKEYHDVILKIMTDIRKYADSAESVVPSNYWPYPSFGDLLFKI